MAGLAAGRCPSVFATSNGDGAGGARDPGDAGRPDPPVSPTQFHNSVHNAAAGYWSIGDRVAEPAACLGCHDCTFAAGAAQGGGGGAAERAPLLLCVYDTAVAAPLDAAVRPTGAFGAAFVLAPERHERALARLSVGYAATPPAPTAVQPRRRALRDLAASQSGGPRPSPAGDAGSGAADSIHAALLDGRGGDRGAAMLDRTASKPHPAPGTRCACSTRLRSGTTASILCRTRSHLSLRIIRCAAQGRLAAVCGIEYRSAGAALHGALAAGGKPQPPGYVAGLRGVEIGRRVAGSRGAAARLRSRRRLKRAIGGLIYRFQLRSCDGQLCWPDRRDHRVPAPAR